MSKTSLSLLEQETIINFNREEAEATIYTHDPSLKRKLDKLCSTIPDIYIKRSDNGAGGVTYALPKNLISVRTPRAKKNLSEEQREVLRERFKKNVLK